MREREHKFFFFSFSFSLHGPNMNVDSGVVRAELIGES